MSLFGIVAWNMKEINTTSYRVFHFNSVTGNDTLCLQDNSKSCQSLDLTRNISAEYSLNVTIEIEEDAELSVVIQLVNGSSFQIMGISNENSHQPVINCHGSSGISIRNSEEISISNLKLFQCNVQNDLDYRYGYAIGIIESANIDIQNLSISNSSGTAVHFSNCVGDITLLNIQLTNNGRSSLSENEINYPGGIQISQNESQIVHYSIKQSYFAYNKAPSSNNMSRTARHHIGYGSALYASISGTTVNSSVAVESCCFKGNSGARGAGLYVYLCNNTSGNKIILNNNNFYSNIAKLSGGGASFGYCRQAVNNTIMISNCSFIDNVSRFGGGMAIFSDYTSIQTNRNIIVTNCSFSSNTGYLSSAVDIAPKDPDQDKNGFLPKVTFIDCTFEKNEISSYRMNSNMRIDRTSEPRVYHVNSGVVIITRFKVLFGGKTTFDQNSFSALVAVSATIELMPHSDITFSQNMGYDGGALGLYGFSRVTLAPHLNLSFIDNHALNHGGAVVYRTIDQHDLVSGRNCFFQHSDLHNETLVKTTHVVFDGNTADVAGNSIYSESFVDCYHQCFNSETDEEEVVFYDYDDITICLGDFNISSVPHQQLVSSGRSLRFDSNFKEDVSVIPGVQGHLQFSVVDDFNQTVNPLMSVNSIIPDNKDVIINNKYTLSPTIKPSGVIGASSTFTFTVISVRQIYIKFNVTLLPCPPGFYHEHEQKVCICATDYYSDVIKCTSTHAKIKLGLWAGYIPHEKDNYSKSHQNLYFSPCATPICQLHNEDLTNSDLLPSSPDNLSFHICAKNREGIMCGRCSSGHSTYYHSRNFDCQSNTWCHLGPLFYVLSEIVPMVIFFIFVITFDLRLTSGSSVGFIFFTQYLDKLTLNIHKLFSYLRTPYRVFYGLFNFEFFAIESLSFCPWHNSQIMDVLALKYITITLALCLVLILVGLLHHNCCVNICHMKKHITASTSVVHGLSAFLVICYSQSSRITFYILKYSVPSGYNGTKSAEVYSFYGGLPYFQSQHLIYAIPALVNLIFITILPPLILLFYPLTLQLLSLCKLSEHWFVLKTLHILRIQKLIPFIDCFQSCYQDKYRCFAGLYFVYRIIILVCFSIDPSRTGFHIYSELALVVFLGIHCVTQPYKKRLHNIIDSLIFLNLGVINGIAVITEQLMEYATFNTLKHPFHVLILIITSLQLILIYLPMVAVIGAFVRRGYVYMTRKMKNRSLVEVPANDVLDYSRNLGKSSLCLNESHSIKRYGSVDYN